MDWRVVFYRNADGEEPVKDFILNQPHSAIAEILHVFNLLYKFNISLGKPYVEKIAGKVWSLRIKHSSDYYRIFNFSFTGRKFVLLHAIKKKSDKLPKRDIAIAISRMDDHEAQSLQ